MSNLIIEWDNNGTASSDSQIIDIYSTNLIEIPLDDYDLADYAYYDALGNYLSENRLLIDASKTRY
jgi:hypothetical protein